MHKESEVKRTDKVCQADPRQQEAGVALSPSDKVDFRKEHHQVREGQPCSAKGAIDEEDTISLNVSTPLMWQMST